MTKTKNTAEQLEKENSLLREQIRKAQSRFEAKIAELSVIREMGMVLKYINNFQEACSYILDVIIDNSVAQNCSLMLYDSEEGKLFLVGATDSGKKNFVIDSQQIFKRSGLMYLFKPGEGAAGTAFLTKEPVLICDIDGSAYFNTLSQSKTSIGSLVCLPLLVEGAAIGIINLSHPKANVFKSDDVNMLSIIATFVALSLNSIRNYEMLKNSELNYKALTENINDGIAIIENELHVYVNPKYREITGYSAEQLRKIPLGRLLDPDDYDDAEGELYGELNGLQYYESRFVSKTNEIIDVGINASDCMYNGRPARIISVRDLTGKKKLERRLQQAQKMEAIAKLAGGVAHDLNNILSGIISYPELMIQALPRESPLLKPLTAILDSGLKAATIVNDMLTLARRGVVVKEVANLNEVVTGYMQSPIFARLQEFHPQVQVVTKLEKGIANILGSPVHLQNSLMNLVSNATEALPEGGNVCIVTEQYAVDREGERASDMPPGDYVLLQVTDNGIGISAVDIERIFEPFYTKKKMGRSGTGLGMSVVWGTVQDHDGYIFIDSEEGCGTTFRLYFPATQKEKPCPAKTSSKKDRMGRGEKILVVDDLDSQREIATLMLQKMHYSVHVVASGEEAVEYLQENQVDLVVLDMMMDPGIDGLETYQRICAIRPGQKAIIVSGYSETDRVKAARKLGAGAFLRKPYTFNEIGKAVQEELNK